jgi:hypothetical protein
LHALAEGVEGSNGVYLSSSSGGFPYSSFNSTSYWVDVLYQAAHAYTVSGTVTGGAGTTVTLSGDSTATTTANSSGSYSFAGLYPGSYSIIPTLSGSIFAPEKQNVSVSNSASRG